MAATTETYVPRLKQRYEDEIRAALKDELELDSIMRVPQVTKITLNMGVGDAKTDAKAMDAAIEELSTIAGQHAQVRRARKSIASFKLREGMAVGARVTLRGARMYEFLDRLVSIALPAHPRLPRPQPRFVRRAGQLLARHQGADHLPGDRLRQRAVDPGPRHRHHDNGGDGRAGACAAAPARPAVRHREQKGLRAWPRPPSASSRSGRRSTRRRRTRGATGAAGRGPSTRSSALPDLPARARHQGAIPGMTKSSW